MKLDAGFGVEGGYLRNAGDAARAAESLGLAGLWSSETRHDAFLPLALAGGATERIKLGTSVAIAFSPAPRWRLPRPPGTSRISPAAALSSVSEPRSRPT